MSTLHALRDLRQRYAQVFVMAWRTRRDLDTVPRLRQESEFLPSALALRDTPVHPAPRIAMGSIVALLIIALAWACFGKVDVVATAAGKIIPNGYVKTIQTQDTAVVKSIYVKDGQHVKHGEVLIDLDATTAIADETSSRSSLFAMRDEIARAQAMLDAVDTNQAPILQGNPTLGSQKGLALEQRVLAGEYADYVSNMSKMKANIAQSTASLRASDEEIQKLSKTLPLEELKEKGYASLIRKGYVSKQAYYTEEQSVIQLTQDLAAQRAKRAEAQAALDAATRERTVYLADSRRTWLEKIHEGEQKAAGLEQELVKAAAQRQLMHVTAPVDGTVQQLAVHTVGGVVTPAQTLMKVVPQSRTLLVEAIIDNQDIGFITVGQPAEIKVETFPFTRYGMLHGTVVQVSNDAKQDDKLGLIFTAQIALPQDTMAFGDRLIYLMPGMAVTAEIKTGRRRIISYVLSPLIQHVDESFHER